MGNSGGKDSGFKPEDVLTMFTSKDPRDGEKKQINPIMAPIQVDPRIIAFLPLLKRHCLGHANFGRF